MKPKFLDEEGHRIKEKYSGLKNAERHEQASHHCVAYRNTGHKEHLVALWELVYVYVLGLPSKEPGLMKGFKIEEVLGEAYLLLERVARRYDAKYGVPFVLYFRLSLAGHIASMRVKESKYVAVDELYGEEDEPRIDDVSDCEEALWILEQLNDLGDTDEVRVAKAYVMAYMEKKLPRHAVIAGYAGMPLKRVSALNGRVTEVVRGLIL